LKKYATAEPTYAERGATRATLPPGHRHLSRHERIGMGRATFRRAVEALRGRHMHRRTRSRGAPRRRRVRREELREGSGACRGGDELGMRCQDLFDEARVRDYLVGLASTIGCP